MINLRHNISLKIVFLLPMIFLLSVGHLFAQKENISLKGTVKDVYGSPLYGAKIATKNNIKTTTSDIDGTFSIDGTFNDSEEFVVSFKGYQTIVVPLKAQKELNVVLTADISGRDNIVSLLTGDRPMSSVGGSATTITSDVLSRTKTASLETALTGRFPGYSSGLLRGASTTNAKTPIVLVDGMFTNSFSFLNLNDIESVTMLKDAATTALYGFQGGNGIISVKTKKGYIGKSIISVDVNHTMESPINTPKTVTSGQYARLYNEAWANDGNTTPSIFSATDVANYEAGTNLDLYPNNNWYDMFIKSLVRTENVHLSGRGGTDDFKYYIGMGYLNQDSPYKTDGTVPETYGTNRIDIRSNLEVKINDFISGYMNISGRLTRAIGPQATDIYSTIFNLEPTVYGPLTPDGKVVITETEGSSTYAKINRAGYTKSTDINISSITGLNFNLSKVLPGLTTGGEIKYYAVPTSSIYGNTDYERYIRNRAVTDALVFTRFGTTRDLPVTFTKDKSSNYRSEYQWNLKYQNTFGNNEFGINTFIQKQRYNAEEAVGLQPFIKMTYGLSMNYAYKNLLYVDFVSGYQGSEQFSSENRYGYFPSLSTALVLSNYSFLKNNSAVTFLKLRGSYGLVGNDNIAGDARFLYKDNLTTSGTTIGIVQLGNPDITWETSRIANVGFDLGLWNKLSLSFEYFNNKRTNILVNNNVIPSMVGVSSSALPYVNDGEITSQGFEAQLGYQKSVNKDLSFGINGYFAFTDNKVDHIAELYLGDDYAYPYRTTGYRVGQSFGYLINYSNGNGYFNSASEIAASGLTYEGVNPRPGDFIYQDLNKDGIINAKDMAPMGYSSIPRISYAAELNLKWKRFNLTTLFYGESQANTFNSGAGFYESFNEGTFFSQHLNAWTASRYSNGETITAPALTLNGSSSQKANDYYFQDKSYLQLREVTLDYTIPANISSKIWSKQTKIYVSGRNLFTNDNMKSDDLAVTMNSVNASPALKSFVVGLNLTF